MPNMAPGVMLGIAALTPTYCPAYSDAEHAKKSAVISRASFLIA
jgi:hypothetical protein